MSPRGGERKKGPDKPSAALAASVTTAVKEAVRPLGGYQLGISISIATDEAGNPAGFVVATKQPRPAKVPDAIDAKPEPE